MSRKTPAAWRFFSKKGRENVKKKKKLSSSAKSTLALAVVGVCLLLLQLTRLFLSAAGVIPEGWILDFAVDSEERLYIGTMERIDVVQDGVLLRSIKPPTSRSYRFIIENDRLIIGCAGDGKGGVFDLKGKELSYGELSYDEVESAAKKKSLTVNGHEYRLSDNWGLVPYVITRDGVEVYRMSTLDYVFNAFPFWCLWACLSLAAVMLILVKVSALQPKKN